MKISVDSLSGTPLYKQIVASVKSAVRNGTLRDGDGLPSLNEISEATGVSMETAKKAYNILKKEGFLRGRQGKGFFVEVRQDNAPKKILMLLDKLSAYKLAIHRGLSKALEAPAEITIFLHNQDIALFETMVTGAAEDYDWFLVAAHFPADVDSRRVISALGKIPNGKLILIDRDIPSFKGHIGRIYQDFETDAVSALSAGMPLAKKYRRIVIITTASSLYGELIVKGITSLFAEEKLDFTVKKGFEPESMSPGTLYIVLGGQLDTDHFAILRRARELGLVLGVSVGIISYNDEPVNEFICGGLTCISSDFEQMGRSAAGMINSGRLHSVHNPFRLVLRSTL